MPNPTDIEKLIFCDAIEVMVYELNTSYLDAILIYCKDNDIEESVAASLISESLKAKIETEALDLHQIKNTTRKLPF